MAILNNTWEITPVTPSLDGPADAHDVRLWITGLHSRDAPDFEHQYNVAGWQLGHSNVHQMADGFQRARHVVDKQFTSFLPDSDTKPVVDYRPSKYVNLCLHFDIIWLHAILSGYRSGEELRLNVRLFLWVSPDAGYAPNTPSEDLPIQFVSEDLFVSVDEAEAFGTALKQECIHAQNERRRLDITHFDDVIDFSG